MKKKKRLPLRLHCEAGLGRLVYGAPMNFLRRLAFLPLLAVMLGATPVQAQWTQEDFLGDWTGRFTCAGTTQGITIRLDRKDGSSAVVGSVNFYPVDGGQGGEGSYHTRFRIGMNPVQNGTGAWIVQPRGYSQVSMSGTLVERELHLQFETDQCEPFVLLRSDAPTAEPARIISPAPVVPPEPKVIVASSNPSWIGVWEGVGTCQRGPHNFILKVYPQMDADGNNATYEAIPRDFPLGERAIYKGVIGDGTARWPIQFVPAPGQPDPIRRGPPSFNGDINHRGLEGRTDELGCSVRLRQVSTDPGPWGVAAVTVAEVPPEFTPYLGEWDGGWIDNVGEMHQVSFGIAPATTGIPFAVFDLDLNIDDRSGDLAIVQTRTGTLDFVSLSEGGQATSLRLSGELRSEVLWQSGTDYFTFRMGGGYGFAMRRPEEQTASLRDLCVANVESWAYRRSAARQTARQLKVEFYPALAGYNEVSASLYDAFDADAQLADGFVPLAYQCLLTSPNFNRWVVQGLFNGVISTDSIAQMRNRLQRFGEINGPLSIEGRALDTSLSMAAKSEDKLRMAVASYNPGSVADILAFVHAQAELVQNGRPSQVAAILAPIARAIDDAEISAFAQAAEARVEAARQRMSNIHVPALPVGRESDFAQLVSGRMTQFSPDQIAFFGGVVGEAIETCGLPVGIEQRLALSSILFSGIDRALFGDGFATGSLRTTLGSTITGTSQYASGANAVTDMGCASPYLGIVLAALADFANDRATAPSGRETLFVRSCALDRSDSQCNCIENELRTLFPNIAQQEYDRSYLASALQMNLAVSIKIATLCQVGSY